MAAFGITLSVVRCTDCDLFLHDPTDESVGYYYPSATADSKKVAR